MNRVSIFVIFVVASSIGCGSGDKSFSYLFMVANDQLFVLRHEDAFGTENAIYTTDDLGESWRLLSAPAKTRDVAGDGDNLFALTSEGAIWRRGAGENSWKQIAADTGGGKLLYRIVADSSGRIAAVGTDQVLLYTNQGKLLKSFSCPGATDIFFSGEEEQQIVVEAYPFVVYAIDLQSGDVARWMDGFKSDPPEGLHGPAEVIPFGDRFLASRHDGIYTAEGLLQPWEELSGDIRLEGPFSANFCRDLVSHAPESNQWLVAKNSGIHLVEGPKQIETVFEDDADEHDLILSITPHKDHYFVSFSRLRDGCIGVRLSDSLSYWQTLKLE